MANEEETEAIIDGQSNSGNYSIKDLLYGLDDGNFISTNGLASCDDSPTRRSIPNGNDSTDSIRTADLPVDFAETSPDKLHDLLSYLWESPEKSSSPPPNPHGIISIDLSNGLYANSVQSAIDHPLLRRSHSWHSISNSSLPSVSVASLSRSKSSSDFHSTSNKAKNWIQAISSTATNGVSSIHDYSNGKTEPEENYKAATIDISGYSLPLVNVDGDPNPYVCVSDVFQAFFGTRHWDEFKGILERNGIRSVAAQASSNMNSLGVPEIVDAISVKEVESLLLKNQARKDGFVRCIRLSMGGETSECGPSSTFADGAAAAAESKVILVPGRPIGELTSGIRTRHGDQSDILYVELDGYTLPSIILNRVQFVRLVDVQTNFYPLNGGGKQPSPTTAAFVKQLNALRNACSKLRIDVSKCKPNEKARMVVYANSCHSSSLHVIAAEQLPRLVEYLRCRNEKPEWKPAGRSGKERTWHRLVTDPTKFHAKLCITVPDDDSPVQSGSSTTGGVSPLSVDSNESSGSWSRVSSSSTTSSAYSVDTMSGKKTGLKRMMPFSGRNDSIHGKRMKDEQKKIGVTTARLNVPGICVTMSQPQSQQLQWQNGNLKWYAGSSSRNSTRTPQSHSASYPNSGAELSNAVSKFAFTPSPTNASKDQTKQFALGRDEDALVGVFAPKTMVPPCKVLIDSSSALPVIVYNRSGTRGPSGKYFDQLFAGRNSECIWCNGCGQYYDLRRFVHHTHENTTPISDPLLFMWVYNADEAKLGLWKSLLRKAKMYNLKEFVPYETPDNMDREKTGSTDAGKRDQSRPSSATTSITFGTPTKNTVIGGGPNLAPIPNLFRRRPIRGDACVDVVERYSAAGYSPPIPDVVGLYSNDHEYAIDQSFAN